ncbi:MerR family transcriptional regulator [Bifidobacterium cuniculi]|uniref:MerR family transcriptional regulator n=1 Tax=Bifidobacterium cuniculi TaxID=1688 RepID=A0A087AW05_9BIFI|nr:MerR family transcriptional regulator [Bifidobacterium cuniculi]KFI62955.1 MerR family transcriptional regulator [Bifidobacterium cuniculi]
MYGYVDVPLIAGDDTMVQGELFPLTDIVEPVRGYRGTVACRVAGITYRQLDYWARKRIVVPSIKPSNGSGSRRLYSFRDIVTLAVSKKLLDIGVHLQHVTNAVEYLMAQPDHRLSHMTIVYDGQEIHEGNVGEEMARMLSEGDAVFAVSVAAIWDALAVRCSHEDHVELTDGIGVRGHSPDGPAVGRRRPAPRMSRLGRGMQEAGHEEGAMQPAMIGNEYQGADE